MADMAMPNTARLHSFDFKPLLEHMVTTALVSRDEGKRVLLATRISDRSDQHPIDIATADPFDTGWLNELEQLLRKPIKLVLCQPGDIDRYRDEFYTLSSSIKQASNRGGDQSGNLITNLEQLVELGRSGKLDAEDHHVVNIVDWLLQSAFEQRASDIHLEPRRDYGEIRLRIDGVLHPVYQVPPVLARRPLCIQPYVSSPPRK